MTKIKQHIIDDIAQMEADALLENLNDPEMRKNPAFLAKVRQFLKDNDFLTTAETEGVQEIIREGTTIPDLVSEEHLH
jgi:hypothetical protein